MKKDKVNSRLAAILLVLKRRKRPDPLEKVNRDITADSEWIAIPNGSTESRGGCFL